MRFFLSQVVQDFSHQQSVYCIYVYSIESSTGIKYHVYHGFISLFHDWSSCEACRRFVSCTQAISWKSCMSSISFVSFVSLMLIRISFISVISCIWGISCISVTPYIYPLKTGVNLEGKLVSQFCRSCEQLTLGTLGCIKCFLMGFPAILRDSHQNLKLQFPAAMMAAEPDV